MEDIGDVYFDRFTSCFGEGSLVTGCYVNNGREILRIPDFKIEDGRIILLSRVEAEAEAILQNSRSCTK